MTREPYLRAEDVAQRLQISLSRAYALIRRLTVEVPRSRGHYVWAGAVYVTAPAVGLTMHTIVLRYSEGLAVGIDGPTAHPSVNERPLVWWGTADAWEDLGAEERLLG